MSENQSGYTRLFAIGKEYVRLKFEYYRLLLVEKLSVLASALVIFLVIGLLCVGCLCFLSVALCELLGSWVGSTWASTIVAGLYAIVAVVVWCLRQQLIVNPITKFISRNILNP
ncbi:MAG: phage holin family protein [Paramuribaculum sp.]|nr:phage holin family protein [Paramuribaculum sp.]